jgi:hypothetical protein
MFSGLPDPHPDPSVRRTDPRIRIHTLKGLSHEMDFKNVDED